MIEKIEKGQAKFQEQKSLTHGCNTLQHLFLKRTSILNFAS